jgi:hypothetical protein
MTKTQTNISEGLIAGFVATVVLSLLMVAKAMMGLMPEINIIKMLTAISHNYVHTPAVPIIGWIIHFVIGTFLWGILFGLFATRQSKPGFTVKGVIFSSYAWLAMMIVMMPLAGAGIFGVKLGIDVPLTTLLLHWVYGGVLGSVYGALNKPREQPRGAEMSHGPRGQAGHAKL